VLSGFIGRVEREQGEGVPAWHATRRGKGRRGGSAVGTDPTPAGTGGVSHVGAG
jgi:hypothetical protein